MRRADLLAELNSEYEAWEGLLAQIGEDRMEEPGVAGSWSIKDVIAHLTAWRRRTVGRLESVARGKPEPAHEWPADLHEDDEINAWFHARDRGKSVREVLSESSNSSCRRSRNCRRTRSTILPAFRGWKARRSPEPRSSGTSTTSTRRTCARISRDNQPRRSD